MRNQKKLKIIGVQFLAWTCLCAGGAVAGDTPPRAEDILGQGGDQKETAVSRSSLPRLQSPQERAEVEKKLEERFRKHNQQMEETVESVFDEIERHPSWYAPSKNFALSGK